MTNQGSDDRPAREGVRRLSVAHFLTALVVWIVCLPFVEQLAYGDLIGAGLITLVLLSAVTAIGGRRRTFITAAVLVTPALVTTWVDHFRPGAIPKEFTFVAGIMFAGFVVMHLLGFIVRAPWVNAEVLCAAVATFLMLGILGGFAFELVGLLVPHSFVFTVGSEANRSLTGFEALYFSFGTLTNYYGDIIPVSRAARTLALVEATAGLFYMAVLISRLVSLYSGTQPTSPLGAARSDREP
jgi:hypothetical protein